MNDRVFLDTNVLAYLLDPSEPVKQARALERLDAERRERELVVSTQVLQELYVALTRGSTPITSPERAEAAVRAASRYLVVGIDTALVLDAIRTSRTWKVSFWDALVLGAANGAGCARVLSEDLSHGQRYGDVVVENPFR